MAVHAPSAGSARRARARVEGIVQGVGFRPYVYRQARERGLTGYVLNDSLGVLLEVEGPHAAVEDFLARLACEAPPLASVERVTVDERAPAASGSFEIRASPRGARAHTPIAPDTATCDQCLAELFDPGDRRWRYPFINCTNCGPRFTIVRGVPYDRAFTTMASFQMCARCRAEYDDPADRRFHAQPNACPDCGPAATLLNADGSPAQAVRGDAVRGAAEALLAGAIVAVKGIGGHHLAALASAQDAVARLRARKHREDKPFALMAASLADARHLVVLDDEGESLLRSPARPIVLAPRRTGDAEGDAVAAAVAPRTDELGVMLAYSPLHHLLLADVGAPLVMTSGNASDEPIVFRDGEVVERVGAIADLLLVHDRPIETRTDDSVVRRVRAGGAGRTVFIRRSRGFVPSSLALPQGPALLACGAELKNTFCLARDGRAWVSHHIGDLENYETLASFSDGIEHLMRVLDVAPEVVVHDLHPEYLSTKWALERPQARLVGVQHHHAHLAACLAEHGEQGPAVGAIFDGTGYGTDGTIWGGELLFGDARDFERVGMLMPARLPGGAAAISEPWRMACAWLGVAAAENSAQTQEPPLPLHGLVDAARWRQVSKIARSGLSSPLTTSVGRLCDAVAALCGVRAVSNYEGQAAIELEAACDLSESGSYEIALEGDDGLLVLDPRAMLRAIVRDLNGGAAAGAVAARFHAALARVTVEALRRTASARACETVVLSGGVFANRRLLAGVADGAAAAGLRVLVPERLPIGDGGISYGQAAVAVARLAAEA